MEMSRYFVKKTFPMHFIYIYTVYVIAHVVGMHYIIQKHSVKPKVDCMLHGSQKHSAHTKAHRFEWPFLY